MLTLSATVGPVPHLDPAVVLPRAETMPQAQLNDPQALWHHQVVSLRGANLLAHGLLTGISHGSLHLTCATEIGAGTRLSVSLPACRPIMGTVIASRPKDTAFRITIFFDPLPISPHALVVGESVWATQLEPALVIGSACVMDRAGSVCALACHQAPELDSWIRLDTQSAVLFGEVVSILPIQGAQCAVGIRLEAVVSKVSEAEA
jgi:hypothetical protein